MVIGIDGNEANVRERVGSGKYAFELLEQFAKHKKHRFLIYLKEEPLADLPKSHHFSYQVVGPKKLWTQFALPLKLFFGKKPDIFFSMGHYGPRFSNVPYVITVHDLSYLHFPQLFKKDDLYQLKNWSAYSIKNSIHIFAVSKTTKEDIVKNYKLDPSKITVTYEGYAQDKFKPQSNDTIDKIRKKYKIKEDYIIFVGTLQPRKNIERLIEAFKQVIGRSGNRAIRKTPDNLITRQPDDLQLVIVGKKGWLYDPIFAKVKTLDLKDKVIFTDYVPDEDLVALISGAKVYVLPSLWEGFGIPVVEAQACGVPVVVSNTSSLPEIVADSGILVDPESVESITRGIGTVLSDEKLRQNLIKKGFENIKRFSWERCAEDVLAALEKVATNP